MEPILPIIVNESWNLSIFETVEAAQNHLEAIDIRNDAYEAYDAEGRLLNLEADDSDEIRLFCSNNAPKRPKILHGLLWEYLVECPKGSITLSPNDTLGKLIEKYVGLCGYSK